jgi:DNA mismatch repair ATPase MutS
MMSFTSILFPDTIPPETVVEPDFFGDLNLDQVIEAITAPKQEYNLKSFFYIPLRHIEEINYRHEILQDMEDAEVMKCVSNFCRKMAEVRRYLASTEKMDYIYNIRGWFLESALLYCEAVDEFQETISQVNIRSQGFLQLRDYLRSYYQSSYFQNLFAEAKEVKEKLSAIRYNIIIRDGRFSVKRYEGEIDYMPIIEEIFARFRQGEVKDYRVKLYEGIGMNHIEAQILEFITRLFPEPFAALDRFCARHGNFIDETLRRFEREVQFYIAWFDFAAAIRRKGLPFCYPEVGYYRDVYAYDGFDLALANALLFSDKPVITNDFTLTHPERVIVVTGPNQGGKTTFARMIGQMHYLAALGLPVPARAARLYLCDRLFTHFERVEDIRNLHGKLQDDLVRIHAILTQATSDSLIIMNEIFASTTLDDAVFLAQEVMKRILALDALCVWVTFIDELASFGAKTVSMVSTVVPEDPAQRTFKIVRKPADGLAYALSLVEKHRLTYRQIKERIPL